jgi:hypothetical protein
MQVPQMLYDQMIKAKEDYIRSLGIDTIEDKLYGLYNSILLHWFTPMMAIW